MDKVTTITTLTTRRPRWQYPAAPPTPRILHLPRRPRRKQPPQQKGNNGPKPSLQREKKGKLVALFDQERGFSRVANFPIVMVSGGGGGDDDDGGGKEERRERVEERDGVVVEEEKWRFQAEMLRAECNLLRMEREIAVKKMERRRAQVERILRSTVHILLSGRKSTFDGRGVCLTLDEDVQQLIEKLEKLQRRSRTKDLEVKQCSHFDKQASLLQRQLQKFKGETDEICRKDVQDMAEASLSIQTSSSLDEKSVSNGSCNMEMLRSKMEELSTGTLIERMQEEYDLVVSKANSSASTSMPAELPDMSSFSRWQRVKETKPFDERGCSGHCKAIVRSVVEQVRAETEQWSQMQEMLEQVRGEMEELQASRDFWEDRALNSDHQIQSLHSTVQEWKQKALAAETKVNEIQSQVSMLHTELELTRKEKSAETARNKNVPSPSADAPNEMEKRVLVCRLKENLTTSDSRKARNQKEVSSDGRRKLNACSSCSSSSGLHGPKRSAFRDIGNSAALARQSSRAVFPMRPPPSIAQENF